MATKRLKRPRDPIQLGKLIVDIATGQVQEPEPEETPIEKRARNAGRKGGKIRAKKLTPAERSEIASLAASARWKKG
jgi:hypothetical protein